MPKSFLGKCSDCNWWAASIDNENTPESENTDFGYCRRNAPSPVCVEDGGECSPDVIWPITCPYDWCGEHHKAGGRNEQMAR